jgi:tetratricopeptide (TPR) repeat protein
MGTASAASSVIGSGSQQTCYWAAKTGAASNAALDSCNAALEDFSLSAEDRAATYANRSAVLLARDAPAEALKSVEQALAIAPELDDAAVNKAGALILLRRYAEARSTLDEALPLIQGDALVRGLFNRAVAAEALGDVKAAYYDYKRAVELSPEFEAARLELSRFQVARAEPGWQTAER